MAEMSFIGKKRSKMLYNDRVNKSVSDCKQGRRGSLDEPAFFCSTESSREESVRLRHVPQHVLCGKIWAGNLTGVFNLPYNCFDVIAVEIGRP